MNLSERLRQATNSTTASAPHLVVKARAGTGKTTTLIEGLKKLKGMPVKIEPSPQQAAVWDAMMLSRDARTVCFCAFNKAIATELQARVPQGCEAMTMHSMGLKSVTKSFGRLQITAYRVLDIISALLETDVRELRKTAPVMLKATEELVGLCKQNLIGRDIEDQDVWDEQLDGLTSHYGVELCNGRDYRREVYDLVPRVLERCADPTHDRRIDFDDMIWLPVALGLPVVQYDLLLVDEAQDLNRCQQALAKKAGRRLILCGDPKQAIYGFAGADARSMKRMEEELAETEVGCAVLPLTVTRRCGKAIVREANKIVPDFEAHESCHAGEVASAKYPIQGGGKDQRGEYVEKRELPWSDTYCAQCVSGDMILCRVNAPLVSQCFRFLKKGIKATIRGRDVAAGLISTIEKLHAQSVTDLVGKVTDWLHREVEKEQARRIPSDSKVIMLTDRADCICAFTEGAEVVQDVIDKINSVFSDDRNGSGIMLSSVHKAKGLEADRVFILMPRGGEMPHPMARSEWQVEQEMNLKYVAITRAIRKVTFVT